MRVLSATALTLALILTLPTRAPAADRDEYPTTGAAAMAYYESDADGWLDGPVEYLILDEERDAWNELVATDQRASFIARFWELRDNDQNLFRDAFYERVAYANTHYRDTPWRGWRSDRGRIAVTLGLPDRVRPIGSGTGVVWTYFTFGAHAEGKGFSSVTGRWRSRSCRGLADATTTGSPGHRAPGSTQPTCCMRSTGVDRLRSGGQAGGPSLELIRT